VKAIGHQNPILVYCISQTNN